MIKKITEILIRNDYHTTKSPQEISDLIKNVRKAVANPKMFRRVDPVTASIAQVLIHEGVAGKPVPTDTDTNVDQTQTYIEPTDTAETIVGTPADYNSIYCPNLTEGLDLNAENSNRKRRRQGTGTDTNSNQDQNDYDTESTESIVGVPDDSVLLDDPNERQESVDLEVPDRKRKRQRRESDEEYVPDKQKMKNLSMNKPKPKTRKSNEHNISSNVYADESITSDLTPVTVLDTDDRVFGTANNIAHIKTEKGRSSKNVNETEVIDIENTIQQRPVENQTANVDRERENASESILLSDDDDVETVPSIVPDVIPQVNIKREKQQNKTNSKNDAPITIKHEKQSNNRKEDAEPPIPLHKSLLTNKNFIKIVAHTYLTKNPSMDEEGAVLAAQYSTLKALKVLEATNKEITSGPIYDIAVQVC